MTETKGYFSRSWSLLRKEQGWPKPFLIMGLANFVPVVGQLGNLGYSLEWSRLVAWGSDEAPARKNVRVGSCIKSGWRGLVTILGWSILIGIVLNVLNIRKAGILYLVLSVFLAVIYKVCQLRATIYQNFTAGYQANRLFDMLKRDFGGLATIVGWMALFQACFVVAIGIVSATIFLPSLFSFAIRLAPYSDYVFGNPRTLIYVADGLLGLLTGAIPSLLAIGYIAAVFESALDMVVGGAVGLWMRQFDVRSWGKSDDPLPAGPVLPSTGGSYAPAPSASAYAPAADSTFSASESEPTIVAEQEKTAVVPSFETDPTIAPNGAVGDEAAEEVVELTTLANREGPVEAPSVADEVEDAPDVSDAAGEPDVPEQL